MTSLYSYRKTRLLHVSCNSKKLVVLPKEIPLFPFDATALIRSGYAFFAQDLQEFCLQFCLNHMTNIVQTENFHDLDKDVILNFIVHAAKKGAFKR